MIIISMIKKRLPRVSFKRILFVLSVLTAIAVVCWYGWRAWERYQVDQLREQTITKQASDLIKDEPGEDEPGRVLDLAAAAALFSDEGQHQKALELLLRAQAMCEKEKTISVACKPGYNESIGDMYQQLNQPDNARTYWQKAIADYKRLKTPELTYEEDIKRVEAK